MPPPPFEDRSHCAGSTKLLLRKPPHYREEEAPEPGENAEMTQGAQEEASASMVRLPTRSGTPTRKERTLSGFMVAWAGLNALGTVCACARGALRYRRTRRLAVIATGTVIASGASVLLERVNDRFFDTLNLNIAPPDTVPEERVLRTLERVSSYRFVAFDAQRIASPLQRLVATAEARSPFHVSARTALTGGVDHSGPCGGLARAFIVLLNRAGIAARKAQIYDASGEPQHTSVEVKLGGRWRVVDPTYAMVWRRSADGEMATAEEVATDDELFLRVLETNPDYPVERYTYRGLNHVHWEKARALKALQRLLRARLGDERVRAIETPYVYERPAYLLGGVSSSIATVTVALALLGLHNDKGQV